MADGKITFSTALDNKELERELSKLSKKIESIERDISGKQVEKSKWVKSAEELGAQLDSAKEKLFEMQAATKGAFSAEQINMQKETVASIQYQWDVAESQVEKYDRQIQSATNKLNQNKKQASEIADQIAKSVNNQNKFDGALGSTNKRFDKLLSRVSKLASRVFLFSVITSGLRAVRDWMGDVISSNDEASDAISRLKGALLTMAQPLVSVVIPVFIAFVNILTAVIGKIAEFISLLGGTSTRAAAKSAKALNNEKNALKGAGGAAKEASSYLAGFDEINKMEDAKSGGGGGSTPSAEPDFDWADSISDTLNQIADLVILIGAGFALWKIGSYLPGTVGDIATKLGGVLIALGGILLMWEGLTDAWENGIDWGNMIEMFSGLAAAAAGLYIALGPVASGIALIVGGLALLVTGFRDARKQGLNLKNTLTIISGIVATGLGFSLLTGSFIPLLIAAIAGLVLAATTATGHGEELMAGLTQICQGFVDFFTGIFTGDIEKSLRGVNEIFDGFRKFVFSIFDGIRDTILSFLNWLDEKTGGKFSGIINFIKAIVSGGFEGIKSQVSETIDNLKLIFSGLVEFIGGVFSGDWDRAWGGIKKIFAGVFNQMISTVERAINTIITGLNWLIRQMNKIHFNVPSWVPKVGGKSIGINIQPINSVSLPRLAQGAVIPPNREFMAVLGDQKHGTNIEAPLETIQEAVALVMDDFISSNMAGQEAVVAVLRDILQAVLGIQIGDDVIGEAVTRYQQKMAVVKGY